jgi:uncharacterized membrane protein YgdD (TMEM256/DUF423 family)
MSRPPPPRGVRTLAACGALLAAASVALAAYAVHGAGTAHQGHLHVAAAVAFGHGLALATLARGMNGRIAAVPLWGLLLGTLLFAGGIASGVLLGSGAALAPIGGMTLILAWLGQALVTWRG